MKKKSLNTKLSLKKITILELNSSKESQVLGGGGILTANCPTMQAFCPSDGCGATKVDGCPTYVVSCASYKKECQDTYFCPISITCPPVGSLRLC